MKSFSSTVKYGLLVMFLMLIPCFTWAANPSITSPSSGSTLSGSSVTFTWAKNGTTVSNWWLYVGSSTGSASYHNSGNLSGGTLSRSVSGLPTNGSTIWARLFWKTSSGAAWQSRDYSYTAASSGGGGGSGSPGMVSPSSGSTLSGSTATFSWAKNGTTVSNWWLYVGPSTGSASFHNSGSLSGGTLSRSVSGLPTNGSTVWVRLYWKTSSGAAWQSRDYSYNSGSSGGGGSGSPGLVAPNPGSTFSGSSVTFSWGKNGASVNEWWLYVGPSTGSASFHNSGSLSGGTLSRSVSGLPTNGSTVWVRLYWKTSSSGAWQSQDYSFNSAGSSGGSGSGTPSLVSPNPSSTLAGSTVTFSWTKNGTSVSNWWLYIGPSVGSNALYNSGSLSGGTLSRSVSGLPTNGSTVWARLYWKTSSGAAWQSRDYSYTAAGSGGGGSSGGGYYVSTSGNDSNAGTQSAPFRTIKFALAQIGAGDTLFVRGGTYWESLQSHGGTNFPSGTSWSNPAKIIAFNNEQVTLRGTIDIGIASPATKYLIFDGIDINATNHSNGIALNGGSHHIRFKNLEIKYPRINGIELSPHQGGSTHNEFINLNIHHTGQSLIGHGIYMTTSYNLIDGCNVHDNYRYGIHIYDGFTANSNFNIVKNSTVYGNGLDQHTGGITIGGDGNRVSNNLVYENFRGIDIGAGNARNTTITNNTVRDNIGYGIYDNGINSTINNNSVFGNQPNYN